MKRFGVTLGLAVGLLAASEAVAQGTTRVDDWSVPDDARTAYRLANYYHMAQMHEAAAEAYLDFARRFPADENAPNALTNAIELFIGLGKNEEAFETAGLFEKNYGAKKIEDTATIVFSVGYVYINAKDWKKVRSHYESYLKRYARAKLLDELIQAHVLIGDSYRQQKKPDFEKALEHYREAAALFDGSGMDRVTDPKRRANLLIASAKAKYELAMEKYRAFEALKAPLFKPKKRLPRDVQRWWAERQRALHPFAPPPDVEKWVSSAGSLLPVPDWKPDEKALWRAWTPLLAELPPTTYKISGTAADAEAQYQHWASTVVSAWLGEKANRLRDAVDGFAKAVEIHVPEWELASAARVGELQLSMAKAAFALPIPPTLSGGEALSRYARLNMMEAAEPYRSAAISAYEYALHLSSVVRLSSDDALLSAERLRMLVPEKYPPMDEIAPEIVPREPTVYAEPELIEVESSSAPPTNEELALAAEREKAIRLVESAPELLPLEVVKPRK